MATLAITTTDATTADAGLAQNRWHDLTFSGTFNGVSIQPTNSKGVPLTESPITAPSRRAVFIAEGTVDYVVSGGTAPVIDVDRVNIPLS